MIFSTLCLLIFTLISQLIEYKSTVDNYHSFVYVGQPIETYHMNRKLKCYTFFADTEQVTIKLNFNVGWIIFELRNNDYWFPPTLLNNYYLAVHSPTVIPEFTLGINFFDLTPGTLFGAQCQIRAR